jgi:hypothetical protein
MTFDPFDHEPDTWPAPATPRERRLTGEMLDGLTKAIRQLEHMPNENVDQDELAHLRRWQAMLTSRIDAYDAHH